MLWYIQVVYMYVITYALSFTYIAVDANECALNMDGCAHVCTNTIGSYYCSCITGYSLGDDGHGCTGT